MPQTQPSQSRADQIAMLQKYKAAIPWRPQPGPQSDAFHSKADVLLYGGAAGGGKTSLAVGLALTLHTDSLFIRREAKQLGGVLDHIAELIDPPRAGYSGQSGEWKVPAWDGVKRKIVIGSTKNPGDEMKFQGRPRDLLVCDEAANLLRSQVEFLQGWVRTTKKGQRTRTLLCSNPPTTAEGAWLIEMFAPWLDPNHPNPAAPGDLRYFINDAGNQIEVDGPEPIPNPKPLSDDDQFFYPKSYSFISAKVGDNKYLGKDYLRELQALPEPLRSQMLYGDFTAGTGDSEWAVIPSAWVDAAMARWEERPFAGITSVGMDPSRGGRDDTVLAARSDWHFHELQIWPGGEIKTGGDAAAKVIELVAHDVCPVHVDVIGIGSSVYDHLTPLIGTRAVAINVASAAKEETDWSGNLKFVNQRAAMWWAFRDLLNPANGYQVSLPRNARLRAELCTPEYQLMSNGIKVESKVEIIKRLGRSTDYADAVLLAAIKTANLNIRSVKQPRIQVNRHG